MSNVLRQVKPRGFAFAEEKETIPESPKEIARPPDRNTGDTRRIRRDIAGQRQGAHPPNTKTLLLFVTFLW